MTQCLLTHSKCRQVSDAEGDWLPTGLINIGTSEESPSLRIVPTAQIKSRNIPYIALSYCWGGDQELKLTSNTFKLLRTGFGSGLLPKTIRDAVSIAKWFEIKYLWVDALCIIQDDATDWAQEAKTMDQVYRGAFWTIAALGAKKQPRGVFARRSQLMHTPCIIFEDSSGAATFVSHDTSSE